MVGPGSSDDVALPDGGAEWRGLHKRGIGPRSVLNDYVKNDVDSNYMPDIRGEVENGASIAGEVHMTDEITAAACLEMLAGSEGYGPEGIVPPGQRPRG